MKKVFILFFLSSFTCFSQYAVASNQSSVATNSWNYPFDKHDSLTVKNDTVKKHSVTLATILSTALPGAGQVYNHIGMPKGKKKAYWKVPLIYTGLGASSYFLIKHQRTKNELKNEYNIRLEGLEGDVKWQNYDDQGVLTLYQQHLNKRDLSFLAVSVVYLLQIVDAAVEAHFVSFDVSPDLSLGIDPVLMDSRTAGIRMTLNIR